MQTNYAAARAHLERAYDHLSGGDETSLKARHALDLLIEAIVIAQHRRQPAEIVQFPSSGPIDR